MMAARGSSEAVSTVCLLEASEVVGELITGAEAVWTGMEPELVLTLWVWPDEGPPVPPPPTSIFI